MEEANLPHGRGQQVDYLFVGHCHHTLVVDLDDAVTHTDATSLGNAAPQKAADLMEKKEYINISNREGPDKTVYLPLHSGH